MTTAITEYRPIEAGLADLRSRYAGVAWDLKSVAGNDAARKARREIVTVRTTLEECRKVIKAPLLARAKIIDDEAKRITGELLAIETPIDEQIKADEARREAERQAKVEAEKRRVAAIRAQIASIAEKASAALRQRKSAGAAAVLDYMLDFSIDDLAFSEFSDEARKVLADAIEAVRAHVSGLKEQEAEAARLAAEREALERAKAEAEERERVERERLAAERAEQDRVAREAREAEEARLAAERAAIERQRQEQERQAREQQERIEAEARAERERIAAAEAEVARQRAEVERREREQREREEAAEAERRAMEVAKARAAEIASERQARAKHRPTDDEIIDALSLHFRVHESTVIGWLLAMDLEAASARMVSAI